MATEYLKRACKTPESETETARKVASEIIADIEQRGEMAVREYARKFDHWSGDILVTPEDVDRRSRNIPAGTKRDIEYATQQVRRFALAQRDCLKDLEIETLPGVVLGHRNVPVNSVGCYIPGGRYPMVASAHMSVVTAKAAGVKRIISCAPPFGGRPHPATGQHTPARAHSRPTRAMARQTTPREAARFSASTILRPLVSGSQI